MLGVAFGSASFSKDRLGEGFSMRAAA